MILIGAVVFGVIGALVGGSYFREIVGYKQAIQQIAMQDVDLQTVEDGVYLGDCDAKVIGAKVIVEVKAHKIVHITLIEHKQERGKKAEAIIDEVIKMQRLDVDTISGATNSSKVILKAIEDALTRKKQTQ